jgi:hypothetical protein
LASEDFVKNQAQRVDITALGDFSPGELLGRHVGRRAIAHLGSGDLVSERREAEVHDENLPPAVDHDVGGLEITMEHAFGMRRRQSRAQLACDLDGFVVRQVSDAAQQAAQVLAIDVFHRYERGAFRFPDVVHAAHVGMRDLPRNADFAVETLQQSRLRCDRCR